MNPEKRQLIESLTDGQALARREATLLAGARVLRYRRWRRVAGRSLAGVVIIAVAVLSVLKMTAPRPPLSAVVAPAEPPGALTDAQLLAEFPNTPVGLITLANGQKRLIFPRPADARRYFGRY